MPGAEVTRIFKAMDTQVQSITMTAGTVYYYDSRYLQGDGHAGTVYYYDSRYLQGDGHAGTVYYYNSPIFKAMDTQVQSITMTAHLQGDGHAGTVYYYDSPSSRRWTRRYTVYYYDSPSIFKAMDTQVQSITIIALSSRRWTRRYSLLL
jgi:hypothetical protein